MTADITHYVHTRAGWGMPLNCPTPIHWWTQDNHQACQPESGSGFMGDRLGDVSLSDACPDCLELVLDSCRRLGISMGFLMEASQ